MENQEKSENIFYRNSIYLVFLVNSDILVFVYSVFVFLYLYSDVLVLNVCDFY